MYNTAGRVWFISDLFDKSEAVNMVKVDNHLSSRDQTLNWLSHHDGLPVQ